MNYAYNTESSDWVKRPLGRKGDLSGWQARMAAACPEPVVDVLVWLDKDYYNRDEQQRIFESVCYRCKAIRANGEAVWERGQVVRKDDPETMVA